jgi:hypothetical protein
MDSSSGNALFGVVFPSSDIIPAMLAVSVIKGVFIVKKIQHLCNHLKIIVNRSAKTISTFVDWKMIESVENVTNPLFFVQIYGELDFRY